MTSPARSWCEGDYASARGGAIEHDGQSFDALDRLPAPDRRARADLNL
jgi:hypothetical protein